MLYAGIAVAVIVLLAVIIAAMKKQPAGEAEAVPAAAPVAAPVAAPKAAPVAAPKVAPARAAAPAVKQPKRHLIVNPTTTFEGLAGSLARTGFQIREAKTGEPTSASWRAGSGIVHYTYEPEIGLRKLEVEAPASECAGIIEDIVNGNAYVSTIDHQLVGMLDPAKTVKELLFGIRGAEWIGRGDAHSFYWQKVGKLRDHADAGVAAEARRVYDALIAEAGGSPIPTGPASLPIAWTKSGADYVARFRGNNWVYKSDGTVMIDSTVLDDKITEWPARWTKA